MEHEQVQHGAQGGAGPQGGVTGQSGGVEQGRVVMMMREHQVISGDLVMEVVMRGVVNNLERGGVRHQSVVRLEMSYLMMNMVDIVMYERLRMNMMNIVMDERLRVGVIAVNLERKVR